MLEAETLVWLMGTIGGSAVLTLGWLARRQISRIDALEQTHVTRDEFNGTVNSLRAAIDANHEAVRKEIRDDASETHKRLDRILERMANGRRAGA